MRTESHGWLATPLVVACLAVVLACGDSTGADQNSDARVNIRVTGVGAPQFSYTPDSVALIACEVDLKATATDEAIRWQDATFRWYADEALTHPFDSAVVEADIIRQSWGLIDLGKGKSAVSGWTFNATVPFTTTLQYRFVDSQGASGTTTPVPFSCRPPVPANPAVPTVSNVTVSPNTEVEPGQHLNLHYSATAGAGLWQTVIQTVGACDTIIFVPEHLAPTADRLVDITLPHSCVHGGQVSVVVQTIDAEVRFAGFQTLGIPVIDRTPPTLDILIEHPETGSQNRQLDGEYFGLDTIKVVPVAEDNGTAKTLVWTFDPGGIRDSLPLAGWPTPVIPVRVPNGLNGAYQMSFQVRDEAGLSSPVIASAPGAFLLHPTITLPTLFRNINGDCVDGVIDEKRGKVYVVQRNQMRIAILSLSTLAQEGEIPLPSAPIGADLSEGGDSLLLAMPGHTGYGVIDLTQSTLSATVVGLTVGLPNGFVNDWRVAATVGGKMLVSRPDGSGPTIQVDLATNAQLVRSDLNTAGMVRSLDRRVVAVSNLGELKVYDPVQDQVSPTIPIFPSQFVSVDRTGDHISVQMKVYNRSLQLVRDMPHSFGISVPVSILSADGSYLMYRYGDYLNRGLVSDGKSQDRISFPYPSELFRMAQSGNYLLSLQGSGRPSTNVVVIDLR